MALNIIQGPPGSGKSYIAVNELMRQWLENSNRPIATNLPLVRRKDGIFELVAQITRNPAKRAEMNSRIMILEDSFHDLGEWTNPETGVTERLGARHQQREFWYFTKPNTVIFLDELAEMYDAKDRSSQPETFASYCRLHRHYKDDFYGFAQDRRDVLAQFRRLVQYVWTVRNSTKQNMFPWWALRGIKWPMQFFMVRCYIAAEVMETVQFEDTRQPEESFLVWPKGRGFKTYESFSKVGAMGWKESAKDTDSSSDVHQGWWLRVAGFVRQSGTLVAMAGAAIVAAYMFWRMIQTMLHPPKDLISSPKTAAVSSKGASVSAGVPDRVSQSETNLPAGAASTGRIDPTVERLVLVGPRWFLTDKGEYHEGDSFGGGIIVRVFVDGLLLERGGTNQPSPWRFLLQGGGSVGKQGGGSDSRSLGRVDSPESGQVERVGFGSTNLLESPAGGSGSVLPGRN